MRNNPELLKQRLFRARNSVLMSRIKSWDNLTSDQIEALNLLLDKFEQLELEASKAKHKHF